MSRHDAVGGGQDVRSGHRRTLRHPDGRFERHVRQPRELVDGQPVCPPPAEGVPQNGFASVPRREGGDNAALTAAGAEGLLLDDVASRVQPADEGRNTCPDAAGAGAAYSALGGNGSVTDWRTARCYTAAAMRRDAIGNDTRGWTPRSRSSEAGWQRTFNERPSAAAIRRHD
jgi:hypothetical protein